MKTPIALLLAAALAGPLGCNTAQGRKPASTARSAELHAKSSGTLEKTPPALTLYFETDAVTLDAAAMDALDGWAAYLREHPKAKLTIDGHADERGTTEYNLGLGEARARTAKKYLVTLGAREDQIEIRTFGEERPAVAGSGEDAWQKNRRDELTIAWQ